MASFLIGGIYKCTKVSAYADAAMKWAVGNGIITGKSDETALDPLGGTLRAECSVIIYRF